METIRYYERRGLIEAPGRSASGRRLFSDDEVATLRFIKRCRSLGFEMADIEALLEADASQDGECMCVTSVGRRHLNAVRAKIEELRALEATLTALLDPCDGSKGGSCQLLDRMLRDPVVEDPAGLP